MSNHDFFVYKKQPGLPAGDPGCFYCQGLAEFAESFGQGVEGLPLFAEAEPHLVNAPFLDGVEGGARHGGHVREFDQAAAESEAGRLS